MLICPLSSRHWGQAQDHQWRRQGNLDSSSGLDPGVLQWEVGGPGQHFERARAVQLSQGWQGSLQTSDALVTTRDQDRTWVKFNVWLWCVLFIIFDRTNNAIHLEEKNILLFIQKSEELFKIKKIFDPKDEKVFRNLNNSWIVLNAIVKLSKHSSRKLRKTEVHHTS